MNTKRMVTIIVTLLLVMGVAGSPGSAVAEPELPSCQTNPWRSAAVQQFDEGSWGYLYRVIWCTEGTRITWAVPEVVPILPDDSDCVWKGLLGNSLAPIPRSGDWLGFAMGWFSCPGTGNDFPWGIIHVRPDGTSDIQTQDTA